MKLVLHLQGKTFKEIQDQFLTIRERNFGNVKSIGCTVLLNLYVPELLTQGGNGNESGCVCESFHGFSEPE